jgi:HAE1 family hydrophobic/amphiphilic exporter-1
VLLRAPVPLEQRNFFFRGFNFLYDRLDRGYTRLVGWMARHSALMVIVALALTATGVYGIARLPTAFIPNEDQGYGLIAVQLPDGASLARTEMTLDQAARIGREQPGVATVIAVSGLSILDNNASLANAGVVYVPQPQPDENQSNAPDSNALDQIYRFELVRRMEAGP